jgi:propanol-preferring alcohol dehydrogenase
MKALVLKKFSAIELRPLTVSEIDKPTPKEKEILVEVSACAVCRTDLHLIEGQLDTHSMPIIPGHQIIGKVVAMGSDCSRFKIGDRVGIGWLRETCRDCHYCKTDRENMCNKGRFTGYQENGGYAEYTVINEDYAFSIPEIFSDTEAAPLMCAGMIGYRAYKMCRLPPGKGRIALFGFGASAHIVIQLALFQGYEVFVSTRNPGHQELARKMGAQWVGGPREAMPMRVDGAIVFSPSGASVPQALRVLKKGGIAVLAGITMTDLPPLNYQECLFHEKILCSVEASTRSDGEEFLALAAQIPIRPLVEEYTFVQVNEVLAKLKGGLINGVAVLRGWEKPPRELAMTPKTTTREQPRVSANHYS